MSTTDEHARPATDAAELSSWKSHKDRFFAQRVLLCSWRITHLPHMISEDQLMPSNTPHARSASYSACRPPSPAATPPGRKLYPKNRVCAATTAPTTKLRHASVPIISNRLRIGDLRIGVKVAPWRPDISNRVSDSPEPLCSWRPRLDEPVTPDNAYRPVIYSMTWTQAPELRLTIAAV